LTDDNSHIDTGRFLAHRRREFLLVAGIALVLVAALRVRTDTLTYDHTDFFNPWDHHKYIWMASNNPFDFHVAPFCWRVATPMLVKALPMDVERGFLAVSYLALWLTGVAVFYLVRRFGFGKWPALAGMFLYFSIGWVVKANLYNIFKPDPLAFLISTLAIYCIVARKNLLYALLLAVGVLAKESVLFVAVLYYTLLARRAVDPKLLVRTILLALPAVAVLVALRTLIPMQNDDPLYMSTLPEALRQVQLGSSTYDPAWLWSEIGLPRLRAISPEALVRYTAGAFGITAAMLPLFAVRRNLSLFLRFLPFLVLVYAQILFATNDTRVLAFGFVPFIILSMGGAERITAALRVDARTIIVLFAALIGILLVRTWMLFVPLPFEAVLFVLYLGICFSWGEFKRPAAYM